MDLNNIKTRAQAATALEGGAVCLPAPQMLELVELIERQERELTGARFAAEQHLNTVQVQAAALATPASPALPDNLELSDKPLSTNLSPASPASDEHADDMRPDLLDAMGLDENMQPLPASPASAPEASERNLPPLPQPEMPHGSRDYFSASQMQAYGIQCAEPYSDLIRAIAFEYSAGGYNSEGLLSPKAADGKLRWIIDDVQKWPRKTDAAPLPPVVARKDGAQ